MKLKSKLGFLLLGATISSTATFITISLTDSDTRNVKSIKLTNDDKLFYSSLYTGKNGLFDKLRIIERRKKLLEEKHFRKFRPSIGIIDLSVVRSFGDLNLPGVETGVHPGSRDKDYGQHSTTISSLLGTRSGVNPFANIYSAYLKEFRDEQKNEEYWESIFKYFSQNNVTVANMSLGNSYFNFDEIIEKIIAERISNRDFFSAFRRYRYNAPSSFTGPRFRSPVDQKLAIRNFISRYWVQGKEIFDFQRFFSDPRLSPRFIDEVYFRALEITKLEIIRYKEINQLYSYESRFIDDLILKYNIKLVISGGNDQRKFDALKYYVDEFKNSDNWFNTADIDSLSGWIPDSLKKNRNTIYVGAVNIKTDLVEKYSVNGTKYQEDYPFVSVYSRFSTLENEYRYLEATKNINEYVKSFNNDQFPEGSNQFTSFNGTSYSSAILAGMISLAEYEVGRRLSVSEVKAALALTSKKTRAWESDEEIDDNTFFEHTTTSKSRTRSGYGIVQYDKFVEAILNNKQNKTVPLKSIKPGTKNEMFKNIPLGVGESVEVSVSWDYVPNRNYETYDDGDTWDSKPNIDKFSSWLNRFSVEVYDNKNKLYKSIQKQPAFSNTRKLRFTNYTFKNSFVDINLTTKNFLTDDTQKMDGHITVSWKIIK